MTLQALGSAVSASLRTYHFGLPLLVLLIFQGLGEWTRSLVGTWIPGSVIGMLLLSIVLWSGAVQISFLERTADWLLDHLGLFFVCPGVEVIQNLGIVRMHWLSLVVAILGSSVVTLLVTGAVCAWGSKQRDSESLSIRELG